MAYPPGRTGRSPPGRGAGGRPRVTRKAAGADNGGDPGFWDHGRMDTAAGRVRSRAITELGHDVYEIDTQMAGYPGITAGYLILGERPCLVETGTAPSAPVVRDALAALGVGPHDLATVVVTHIHLDHAGGAGDIAAMFPDAEVVVHERGARHLADPARLMSSARMVYGDALDTLFGTMNPTPAGRIRTVEERGTVDLGGGRRLDSHYSPGHAKHHVGLIDSVSVTCTSATRPGCTSRRPGTCGRPPRRPTSTWIRRWARSACSPRCARSACCSATTGRSRTWRRPWPGRPKRSGYGGGNQGRPGHRAGLRPCGRDGARADAGTLRGPGPDADPAIAAKFETLSSTRLERGGDRGLARCRRPGSLRPAPGSRGRRLAGYCTAARRRAGSGWRAAAARGWRAA